MKAYDEHGCDHDHEFDDLPALTQKRPKDVRQVIQQNKTFVRHCSPGVEDVHGAKIVSAEGTRACPHSDPRHGHTSLVRSSVATSPHTPTTSQSTRVLEEAHGLC